MKSKTKYNFSKDVSGALKGFEQYLFKQGYARKTIVQKTNYAGYYIKWLEREHLSSTEASYNDMLNYIDYCHEEKNSTRLINNMLSSIREYYQYLKNRHPETTNPALNLYLKGVQRKLPGETIAFNMLEKIYKDYPERTDREKRNKIILSLIVYQGLDLEELNRLEFCHIKLKGGKIYIPGDRKRNSRLLELKPFQIIGLHEYLSEIRPGIFNNLNELHPARKPYKKDNKQIENQLFVSMNGSVNIASSVHHMFRAIRKEYPEIKKTRQIRTSVITWWLKNYNLRQVQYMAGHKYVSSTIRYQLNNLESLQEKLEKLHPLNNL